MRTKRQGAKVAHTSEGADDPRLRWYPKSWRDRYGDELASLLDDEYGENLPTATHLGLITGGLRQRARQSGLTGDSVPAADRVRIGALVVLAAWVAFVVAGASFAKFSEHFDEALPHNMDAHHVPDLTFTVLQTTAGIAGILVIVGALLVIPSLVRLLRVGGGSALRGHFVRALAASGLTVVVTVPLLIWAHRLTPHQRNGGLHWYGALYLGWAILIVVTLTLWTVLAIATARRLQLSTWVLAAEAVLAGVVALAMVLMVAATAFWWGAMANDAPSFLRAGPTRTSGSPWDLQLVVTVALMALAVCTAAFGVVRQVRGWLSLRVH